MNVSIDRSRLFDLLEIYGADLNRWADDERRAAEALIEADDAEFVQALDEARMLDDVLGRDEVAPPSIALETKILNSAPTPNTSPIGERRSFFALTGGVLPRWASAAGMALALVGGVGVGYAQTSADTEQAYAEAVLSYVDQDWTAFSGAGEDGGQS